jgi:hypothetical protein
MSGFDKSVADLISGTPIEGDESELASLRKLPFEEQLEVGVVLHAALLQKKLSDHGAGNARLAGVRSVTDAVRYLDQIWITKGRGF